MLSRFPNLGILGDFKMRTSKKNNQEGSGHQLWPAGDEVPSKTLPQAERAALASRVGSISGPAIELNSDRL